MGRKALAALWLGGFWLLGALIERRFIWFVAFQTATTLAAVLGVGRFLQEQAPTADITVSFSSYAAIYALELGLGTMALLWALLRRLLQNRRFAGVYQNDVSFDYLLLAALVIGNSPSQAGSLGRKRSGKWRAGRNIRSWHSIQAGQLGVARRRTVVDDGIIGGESLAYSNASKVTSL